MRLGGGGHDQRVAGGQQTASKASDGAPASQPDRLGPLLVGIVDAGQQGPLGRRDLERVIAAEMSGARDPDAQSPLTAWPRPPCGPLLSPPGITATTPATRARAERSGLHRRSRIAILRAHSAAEGVRMPGRHGCARRWSCLPVMMYFSRLKTTLILGVCVLGALLCIPNLIPAPASWLPWRTVHLGLDLRGGSYLLLEVDMKAVIKERLEALADAVRQALRPGNIFYQSLAAPARPEPGPAPPARSRPAHEEAVAALRPADRRRERDRAGRTSTSPRRRTARSR